MFKSLIGISLIRFTVRRKLYVCLISCLFVLLFTDRHDGSVLQRLAAGPTADAHWAREAVVHRARGVRAGVCQRQPAYRLVVQRHEKDQESRILRSLVQPTELSGCLRNMQGAWITYKNWLTRSNIPALNSSKLLYFNYRAGNSTR